ncbi:MAG: hypothetical protein CUN55_02060 [Phototrophicales bacterium]|nr:MAG: hypothetical protein CUN55_02060 [Phototrophicales bacterium]
MSEYDYTDEPIMQPSESETFAESEVTDDLMVENSATETKHTLVLEELTLAQALGLLLYRPVRASRELWRIIAPPPRRKMPTSEQEMPISSDPNIPVADVYIPVPDHVSQQTTVSQNENLLLSAQENNWIRTVAQWLSLDVQQLLLAITLALSIIFAIVGANILRDAALDEQMRLEKDTGGSFFWFFLSAVTYLASVIYSGRHWWRARLQRRELAPKPAEQPIQPPLIQESSDKGALSLSQRIFSWIEGHFAQLTLVPVALLMSYLAYARNVATDAEGNITGIVFTPFGFTMWVLALITWIIIFSIDIQKVLSDLLVIRRQTIRWPVLETRWRWTHIAFLIIVLVGGYFRLNMLDEVPPDMTSDHIEKLIDATRVNNGVYAVFFANNGGREAFQMYVVAAIADWFGVGFNFRALKYATIIEGMLSIILSFWVVKEIVGRDTPERRQLGDWLGLCTAALMAISFWHVMLSRLGLRIVLTPLTTWALIYFLIRGIRYNRRADFVWVGLVLGLGTYFYQANRMLPILVVLGVVLAILFNTKLKLQVIWRYGMNLAIAALIAWVAYLPMYHYSQVFELEFWNRTYGRIFGEDAFRCYNEQTRREELCRPSIGELLDLLSESRYGPDANQTAYQAFYTNYTDALASYMYVGERQWITNVGGNPALDATTAGLYMLGFLMWIVLAVNRRDVALLLVPIGVFVMVIPSALAIAPYLRENPSFTRISGTLPFVFMMAALPLATLVLQFAKAGHNRLPYYALSATFVVLLLRSVAFTNFDIYFNDYRESYALSWRPYSKIAAPLVEYVEDGGSFGNAFYVNYPHWLDHRILGTVAGDMTWPNGLFEATDVYNRMLANQNTPYAYDPQRPLLFYIHPLDVDDIAFLQERFPNGQLRWIEIPDDTSFYIYEVPAGLDWLAYALTTQTISQGCIINCLPGPR